jgi:epoxyqueuosine reductase QueG
MSQAEGLTEEIERAAREAGADLVGFANVERLADLPRAVSFAIRHRPEVLRTPEEMPNPDYHHDYVEFNKRLTEIAEKIAAMLQERGHRAIANPGTSHAFDAERLVAPFQHKTAATRAGLGWIGKCALLVTQQLGPVLRLGSLLTDAPLDVGESITESECGDCMVCVEACPAEAMTGENWYAGRPRQEFYDAFACRDTCRQRSRERGIDAGICGVCMAVCPRRPG